MFSDKDPNVDSHEAPRKGRAAEIANTFELLITCFILAFLWRAFVMEAFRIPTGSMADTLMGAHFRMRCPQCGYKYNYGFKPEAYGFREDSIPQHTSRHYPSRCPSCGHYQATGGAMPISNGDRILVLKCLYQFFEPKQWDVAVFNAPLEPRTNFIKRLVGRPGETVEIIDGDIYIDGQISRKPPKVQNELWMPVYDADYRPVKPEEGSFNGHKWVQPFRNIDGSKWVVDENNPTGFSVDGQPGKINSLIYDTSVANNFRASYAYGNVEAYRYMPYCSDLKVRFYINSTDNHSSIGISLSKYQNKYKAWIDLSGEMNIAVISGDSETILAQKHIEPFVAKKSALVEFVNVDHQLIFRFGDEKLVHDLGRDPNSAGQREVDIQPEVKIFASGKLKLSHIAIFRDIHYTKASTSAIAIEGNPLTLGKDEFFMLGDNSPDSGDGRLWNRPGIGNNDSSYTPGVVPRQYLLGKAMFVYWPGGFKLSAKSRFAIIPNIGQMRLIYGGSKKKL